MPLVVRRIRSAGPGRHVDHGFRTAIANAARPWRRCSRRVEAAGLSHPDDAGSRAWRRSGNPTRSEGAGLDGVIAKPEAASYQPGKRAMFKIKHARTADCVVSGFRWHKKEPAVVGSLLLGLFDDQGLLHHVGVTSSFTMEKRKQLVAELEPLRKDAMAAHPWKEWVRLREDASTSALRATADKSAGTGIRRISADAWRTESMECRQGFVVGAAPHRACVRSEVRPHAGRSIPPRRHVPPLARRQGAEGLQLRSARSYSGLRACRVLRASRDICAICPRILRPPTDSGSAAAPALSANGPPARAEG